MSIYYTMISLVAFCAGAAIAYCVKTKNISKKIDSADIEARRLLKDAAQQSEMILKEAELEAKDKLFRSKSEFDVESKEAKVELRKRDKRLIQKEEKLDHKAGQIESKDRDFARKEKLLKKRESKINSNEQKYNELDEQIAKRATLGELKATAKQTGYKTLADDAIRCVLEGRTSLTEVTRVIDLTQRLM